MLVGGLPAGSETWHGIDAASPRVPPVDGSGSRLGDEMWEALNRATGRHLPRGDVISLDAFLAANPEHRRA